jgi:hypothetical protein
MDEIERLIVGRVPVEMEQWQRAGHGRSIADRGK